VKPQFIDIIFSKAGKIQVKKTAKTRFDGPFHFHHLCELVWVEEGVGTRIIGDSVSNFKKNDLVLMAPNLPHIWRSDASIDFVKSTTIYFDPDFLSHLTDDEPTLDLFKQMIQKSRRGMLFYGETRKKVVKLLSKITETEGIAKIIDFLKVIELLTVSAEFSALATILYNNRYDEKDAGRIYTVYQYLLKNFKRDITLKEVADLCHMTTNSFCRFFKSRTNKSFTRFLNELRIGYACELLHDEQHSIAGICYECGYNTTANFHKFFKQIQQTTPAGYRKKLRRDHNI